MSYHYDSNRFILCLIRYIWEINPPKDNDYMHFYNEIAMECFNHPFNARYAEVRATSTYEGIIPYSTDNCHLSGDSLCELQMERMAGLHQGVQAQSLCCPHLVLQMVGLSITYFF